MSRRWQKIATGMCLAGMLSVGLSQFRGGGGRRRFNTGPVDRGNTPDWQLNEHFRKEAFTFARIKYRSSEQERSSYAWWTDYPDADVNLSFRLHQVTAMEVQSEPKYFEIDDPEIFNYPWLFMSGAGNIVLDDEQAAILRNYLTSGGFIMVDDFWGGDEWRGVARAFEQILPGRQPEDLPRSHPLFHCVFDIPDSLSLQTCNIHAAIANRYTGITWEDDHGGGDTRDIHIRAIFDDHRRIMVLFCHNTDNGDGWEEEGSDAWFFSTYSEKKNYPFAINMLFYAMTH
jgi:hypothetical protein